MSRHKKWTFFVKVKMSCRSYSVQRDATKLPWRFSASRLRFHVVLTATGQMLRSSNGVSAPKRHTHCVQCAIFSTLTVRFLCMHCDVSAITLRFYGVQRCKHGALKTFKAFPINCNTHYSFCYRTIEPFPQKELKEKDTEGASF